MNLPKLYMVLLGCCPKGRLTEQHDVFFGIANTLPDLVPAMNAFWPEAKGNLHIDAYREVSAVSGFEIEVVPAADEVTNQKQLFFINLGGYAKDIFDEAHYKMLVVAATKADAIFAAKQTDFYKKMGFKGATSHVDDKYGVDVDEVFNIADVLSKETKSIFQLKIKENSVIQEDKMVLGYIPFKKIMH